jgi:hypothetical protein
MSAYAEKIFRLPSYDSFFKEIVSEWCRELGCEHRDGVEQVEVDDEIIRLITPHAVEGLRLVFIEEYTEHYTESELQEIYDFYSKPVAEKMTAHVPLFMKKAISQRYGLDVILKPILTNTMGKA